jgi:hypothetical protein
MDDIVFLRCEAVAWVDQNWPGWIRVRLIDATGRSWYFVDKVPIFHMNDSAGAIDFPAAAFIRCRIIGEDSNDVISVSTAAPDFVEAEDGTTEFGVPRKRIERNAI